MKACFICGAAEARPVGRCAARKIMECLGCRLQLLDPSPEPERLEEIYRDYYSTWQLDVSGREVSDMKRATFEGHLDRLMPQLDRPPGRFLDVGCATGEMLAAAEGRGFDVYGVEVAPEGVARCRESFGSERIKGGILVKGDFEASSFQVVTMCDVIEHVPDPGQTRELIEHYLEPGGLLLLTTPDTSMLSRRLMGSAWPQYKEEHLHYFSRANLLRWLSATLEPLVSERATKTMTLRYVGRVLRGYGAYWFIRAIGGLFTALPGWIGERQFRIGMGEMLMVFRVRVS